MRTVVAESLWISDSTFRARVVARIDSGRGARPLERLFSGAYQLVPDGLAWHLRLDFERGWFLTEPWTGGDTLVSDGFSWGGSDAAIVHRYVRVGKGAPQ